MSLWIKICGLSDQEMIDASIEAGADAIGFVLDRSPREVSLEQACALKEFTAGRCEIVAVMRQASPDKIRSICADLQPDWIQANAPVNMDSASLQGARRLPVVRGQLPAGINIPDGRCLYEGAESGIGQLADWSAARKLARSANLVLAGGLTPQNVSDAVRSVRPFGVDVSSGVETSPGRKDPGKIHQFISAARQAHAALNARETVNE
ncbi:phosphoribosylanthranilate isomerase [Hyphobacterium sp. HN65]|uniref:N-(5'-phosphoribosyl)anthranilate isomerase n=1 Tax=Hyphobacterium lacteum TaxID=3116575 RepID=A0ABU7LT43_9PROT|nr:phosphoribosylanthranilate isomerase [Hyphobacterium sp. HN65]MEE2526816.1 phosphoribosylanthranilate isomerase [Hyphobacterium sp. HN65]